MSSSVAQNIVSKFGGQSVLAKALGIRQSTVAYWVKQGTIPEKRRKETVEAALKRGLVVSGADFEVTLHTQSDVIAPPEARWPGVLQVGEQELPCYVLDDGRRAITRTGALNFLTGGKGGGNLESYLRIEVLAPFLPQDLDDQFFDISIPQVVNKTVRAMSASAFIDICRAYARVTQVR